MTTTTARAVGGPAAGGSGKITRDVVLAAALEIIDRDGVWLFWSELPVVVVLVWLWRGWV